MGPSGTFQLLYEPYRTAQQTLTYSFCPQKSATYEQSVLGTSEKAQYYKLVYATNRVITGLQESPFFWAGIAPTVQSEPLARFNDEGVKLATPLIERQYKVERRINGTIIGGEFLGSMIPLRNTIRYAARGEMGEATLSAAGDALLFLGMWAKAAQSTATAVKITKASMWGQGALASIRSLQGLFEYVSEDGDRDKAVSYFGEAALRLIGLGADYIWLLRNAPKGLKPGKDIHPDIIGENMSLPQINKHGDPGKWKFLGEKGRVPAHSSSPGTEKVYEVWTDEFGKTIEVHYFDHGGGVYTGVELKPYSP